MSAAAGAESAGGPALAPLPEPPVPWLLVGRRVRRALPAASGAGPHLREGVVIGVHTQPTGATLWRIHYEASGSSATSERDELSWPELSAALVNEAREASRQGLAPADTGAPTPVVTPTPSAGSGEPVELDASADDAGGEATSLQRTECDPGGDGARAAADHGQQPAATYKGVHYLRGMYISTLRTGGCRKISLGAFSSALDAANAYDSAARQHDRLCLNFPLPGTDEVQAVAGESEANTLRRAGRAPAKTTQSRANRAVQSLHPGGFVPPPSLRKRVADAAAKGGRPTALPSHPVPLWGSAAPENARAFKRQRTSAAVAGGAVSSKGGLDASLRRSGQAPVRAGNPLPACRPSSSPFKGVVCDRDKFRARLAVYGNREINLGTFFSASAAARAYDEGVRQRGGRVVNFPRPDTDEIQAVAREADVITLRRAGQAPEPANNPQAGASGAAQGPHPGGFVLSVAQRKRPAAAAAEGGRPTALPSHPVPVWGSAAAESARALKRQRICDAAPGTAEDAAQPNADRGPAADAVSHKGVYPAKAGRFRVELRVVGGPVISLGRFSRAADAAHAYDAAARQRGMRVVNFPRPGTNEVQAVKGEADAVTLLRVGRAPAATPRAGAHEAQAKPSGGAAASPAAMQPQQDAAPVAEAARAPRPAQPSPVVAAPATSSPASSFDAGLAPPPTFTPAPPAAPPGGELAAFLRGISPPLAGLDAALAAARSSGMTMAHLRCAAEKITQRPDFCKTTIDFLSQSLGLGLAADQFSLMLALQSLSSDDI